MQNKQKSLILQPPFYEQGLIDAWNELQRSYHLEGLTVIEHPTAEAAVENNHWRCYRTIEVQAQKEKKEDIIAYNQLNYLLEDCFTRSNFVSSPQFWIELRAQLNWKGFFMPNKELLRLPLHQLEKELQLLLSLRIHFPYVKYLETVKKTSLHIDHTKQPLVVVSIWQFLRYYTDFLHEVTAQQSPIFQELEGWFVTRFRDSSFEQLLPSAQISLLLLVTCEQYFWDKVRPNFRQTLLEKAQPEVQAFFGEYTNQLKILFEAGFQSQAGISSGALETKLQKAYYDICQLDLSFIKVQEVLDNASRMDYKKQMPEFVNYTDPPPPKTTVLDRIQSAIKKIYKTFEESDKPQSTYNPAYLPPIAPFMATEVPKWYELPDDIFEQIQQTVQERIGDKINYFVRRRWHHHLQNLATTITSPVLIWVRQKHGAYPQWNTFTLSESIQYKKTFTQKLASEQAEKARLTLLLKELLELKEVAHIDGLLDRSPRFDYGYLQDNWEKAVANHRLTMFNRSVYRKRRMREFGILLEQETIDSYKNVWLDEMLAIEKEVRPYILYVKQAFQAALPVRRSVEFHPYRHNHDGVEFDPYTVQDPNKWIRARVMKTLQHRVVRGEVAQVNTFCLDLSGSMNHEKMRNLFKLLFLLIYGLEDRKSYDAVHFFNNAFIKTVPFSKHYTNRNLLFKVLTKIAEVKHNKILYRGFGGTNISDAVDNCHQEILEFTDHLRKRDSTINIARSIFVITDGEPALGIFKPEELNDFILEKRQQGNVAIKGIYIKPKDEFPSNFMSRIFGVGNFVETTEFNEAIDKLVALMAKTYKAQRRAYKWEKRKSQISQINNKSQPQQPQQPQRGDIP